MSLFKVLSQSFSETPETEEVPETPAPVSDVFPPGEDLTGDSEDRDDASAAKAEAEQTMFEITNLKHTVDQNNKECKVSLDDDSASNSTVSFGSVQVREYERVIDSSSIYMGLSLGWNYNETAPAPVSGAGTGTGKTKNHTSRYTGSGSHGGDSKMKRTNGSDRYGMMMRYGYAQKELKQATKEAATFYKQRQREAARSIVVADERNKQAQTGKPKKRMLFRSRFG